MKIKVLESTMVRPISATPMTSLWMSSLDIRSVETYYTLTLYFFRPNGAANFFDGTVLKTALSRTLVEFYPVAGRLKIENDCIELNCNGEGVLFVEAEADGDMDGLGDFAVPRPDVTLIPTVDCSKEVSTRTIFNFQVTRFKCGGVCLGVASEHHVSDGPSAMHFINTWSNMARGIDPAAAEAVPPFFDRTLLRARHPPEPKFPHIEYHPPPTLVETNLSSAPKRFSSFKLTRAQLNALKAKCKQGGDEESPNYTTYEVLAAHLWCCISIARGLSENQETMIGIPVNGRTRLRPPLPPGYYGNVVFKATAGALAGELMVMGSGLMRAVGKIRETLVRMDDEYLRSALDYLEVWGSIKVHALGVNNLGSPNLGIVSWARLPLYDADFGWGKAAYVGLASALPDGKVVVLPSADGDGGLVCHVCAITMPEEQMELFQKLLYDI